MKANFSISSPCRCLHKIFLLSLLTVAAGSTVMAQTVKYNLSQMQSRGELKGENRSVQALPDKNAVRVSGADGYGVAWLKNVKFSGGTIEVDVRGKDIKQGSFVGIAFHGTSMNKCEAIYFRPFNFLASDSAQKTHMVQYVFESEYEWDRLRKEHPGVYEKQILLPPDPNEWFHVKIEVKEKWIKVYVNQSAKACLEVKSLNPVSDGGLGLWVGHTSEGDFADLRVRP